MDFPYKELYNACVLEPTDFHKNTKFKIGNSILIFSILLPLNIKVDVSQYLVSEVRPLLSLV